MIKKKKIIIKLLIILLNHLNQEVENILKKSKRKRILFLRFCFLLRWETMPNPKDYFSMNISPSATDVLLELQTIFSILSTNLLKNVFNEIRARIIINFDEYLFNCV